MVGQVTMGDPSLVAALGMVGVFGAALNVPITTIMLGIDMFGAQAAGYFVIVGFVSYLVAGHAAVYPAQRIVTPKRRGLKDDAALTVEGRPRAPSPRTRGADGRVNVNRMDALGRVLIVVNPAAQSGAAAGAAERLKRFLTMYCHREAFDIAQTERPRHATEIAAGAAEYDTVIALGGDGVAHEVACGLMRIEEGRRPTLGVIPVGSGNDFARTLGLTDVTDVSGTDFSPLLTSSAAPIDVLEITCRSHTGGTTRTWTEYAVQTISFGLRRRHCHRHACHAQNHGPEPGAPLYLASGLKAFGRDYRDFPAMSASTAAARKRVRRDHIAIQNGPTYGSGFRICPQADPCDGLLDVCYATGPVPRAVALPVFLSAKNGGHTHSPHVHLQRAKRVDLVFPSPTYPIQLDGEQVGAAEMSIEVLPSALSVLWPR